MLVFDLPSFPYVFKVIKDFYPAPKETSRELIQSKYLLVKTHDRVGHMADTLEYSNVAFPRARFEPELVAELKHYCPSLIEEDGDTLVIRHVYIERRMIPLNIYLQDANEAHQLEHAVVEYGNAIKDLVAPTSSPATCCGRTSASRATARWCSTTTTRSSTSPTATSAACPEPRTEERRCPARSGTTSAGRRLPRDLRPLPARRRARARGVHEAPRRPARRRLLAGPQKERIQAGHVHDVFPYDQDKRFRRHRQSAEAAEAGI